MGFSRQEYWSGLPGPSPGDLPGPGIERVSLALTDDFFATSATWAPLAAQNVKNLPAMLETWVCGEQSLGMSRVQPIPEATGL